MELAYQLLIILSIIITPLQTYPQKRNSPPHPSMFEVCTYEPFSGIDSLHLSKVMLKLDGMVESFIPDSTHMYAPFVLLKHSHPELLRLGTQL